jgi:hypothetical protein
MANKWDCAVPETNAILMPGIFVLELRTGGDGYHQQL